MKSIEQKLLFCLVGLLAAGELAADDCPPAPLCPTPAVIYRSASPSMECRVVERTIWVPETTEETRTITEKQYRTEEIERDVTVYDRVPEVVDVESTETVLTTQTQLQSRTQTVLQPVYRDVTVPVRVAVQGVETRVGTRQVLQIVPVQVQRAVTQQCQCVQTSPGRQTLVQQSQPVTRLVTTVENRQQLVNQQVAYQVPVTRYVTHQQTQRVLQYQQVQRTVQVPVQVQVPQQRKSVRQVVQYKNVPRTVKQKEQVSVPVTVEREVKVPVTRYVQKTIREYVYVPIEPACPPTPLCVGN